MKIPDKSSVVRIFDEELWLLPNRTIFWPGRRILLIADLHLGKGGHFRKHGVPVPKGIIYKDLETLRLCTDQLNPGRIIFLGDLFHSTYNREWEVLAEYFHGDDISWELVPGNHDILEMENYQRLGIEVQPESLDIDPFRLVHIPLENNQLPTDRYILAGHIHPAVRLGGNGRQSVSLPCFWLGENQGILPAFGSFTGTARIRPDENDQVFAIAEDEVIKVR